MASFAALDKRMMRDVNRIHDFLWHSEEKIDGEKLLADLEGEARELDAYLGAGGKLGRHTGAIARKARKDKDRHGGALYELLYDVYNLTAATEHVRKGDYKGGAEHVSWVVESDSIGMCVALDSFPLVHDWEGGTIDFETYAARLTDLIQAKGIPQAGQYKRAMLLARTFGKEWDGKAARDQQALAARTAVEAAAWSTVAGKAIREVATHTPSSVPASDYRAIIRRIVSRL
jgi:hypothetical protein